MIQNVTVTNYLGESLKMDLDNPRESGFLIRSIDGLGAPKATINTTDLSNMDGSVFNSARAESRNIVFDIVFWGPDIESLRQKSYRYFPAKKPLTLTFETDNRTSQAVGYVESNEPDIFSSEESTQISIICPYAFVSALNFQKTVISGLEAMFEFPFSNESLTEPLLVFSNLWERYSAYVVYKGDADTGAIITLSAIGDAKNITIANLDTREQIKIDTDKMAQLTGKGFQLSDSIIISTVPGDISAQLLRDGDYYNILNCVDRASQWFLLTKGNNHIGYVAEEGTANIRMYVENKVWYEGV